MYKSAICDNDEFILFAVSPISTITLGKRFLAPAAFVKIADVFFF